MKKITRFLSLIVLLGIFLSFSGCSYRTSCVLPGVYLPKTARS